MERKSEEAAQVTTVEDGPEPEREREREREPCAEGQKGAVMLKVEVPIRGIDEWVLWTFLEKMFGDENFSVVVSDVVRFVVSLRGGPVGFLGSGSWRC